PVANAMIGLDGRDAIADGGWRDRLGPTEIFETTGMSPSGSGSIEHIFWWRENARDVFDRARMFCGFGDYVLARLGAPPTNDPTLAARTGALDLRGLDWSARVLECAGLAPERLPIVRASGSVAGEIPPDLAAEIGLERGVVLATGGDDRCCAALGAGAV